MSSEVSDATTPSRRPWWLPFVLFGAFLAVVGLWMYYYAEDSRLQVIGVMCFAGAAIAIVGVTLSFWHWGRVVMGVYERHSRWVPFWFSKRGWAQAALIVLVFGTVGFGEFTMQPDFCQSCHIMVPYYKAWHESTHRNIPCQDCHFEPGWRNTLKGKWQASSQVAKYVTRTYGTMPHAEIQDASCLREGCHEKRLLEGQSEWEVKKPNGAIVKIRFDHKPHLEETRRGRQLRCTSCHSQIVQGEHVTVTVGSCFLCHFKGLRHGRDSEVLGGCTGCHNAPKEEIRLATGVFNHKEYIDRGVQCYNCHSDSIKGDGEVPRQACMACHNTHETLSRYGETNFLHTTHVTDHKVDCTRCHIEIEHNVAAGVETAESSCNRCHEQTHGGPAKLYRGEGGRGIPAMPSPMFRAQVDCIACHQFKEHNASVAKVVGQTFVAEQKSCDMCHGDTPDPKGGKYAEKLAEWKGVLAERTKGAKETIEGATTQLAAATMDAKQRLELERKLADARHNLTLVELGHGVHNYNYSVALLGLATEWSQEVSRACGGPASGTAKGAP